jgi:tetratricopeptide (TPR) repeat protein
MRSKTKKIYAKLFAGLCLLTCVCLLLGTSTAMADEATKKAKVHFKKGNVHAKLGRFKEALAEFSKAYELKPLPAFLFNIGQCHRHLKNYEKAIYFFESYLRDKPQAKNRKFVTKEIKTVKKLLAEQRAKEEEQKRLQEQQRVEEERQAALLKQKQELEKKRLEQLAKLNTVTVTDNTSQTISSKPEEVAPFYKSWWFWTLVGCVVVGTSVGIGVGVGAQGDVVQPSGSLGFIDWSR